MYDVLPLTYMFETLTILPAPFFAQGRVTGLAQAGFIRQYFPLFFIPERDLIIGAVLALALGFVAGILPALQAMRLRLAEALRREG